jgi:hypothetical protein
MVLWDSVVKAHPAFKPIAVLTHPVVKLFRALHPMPTLNPPPRMEQPDLLPTNVFAVPLVKADPDRYPMAMLPTPVAVIFSD